MKLTSPTKLFNSCLLATAFILFAGNANAQSPTWIPKGATVPANAVAGGTLTGKTLHVCRVKYKGGIHPGRLFEGDCIFSWGGKEVISADYEVLVGRGTWGASSGNLADAFVAGNEADGRPLRLCRISMRGSLVPGKVVGKNCLFGWNNQELGGEGYELFFQGSGSAQSNAAAPSLVGTTWIDIDGSPFEFGSGGAVKVGAYDPSTGKIANTLNGTWQQNGTRVSMLIAQVRMEAVVSGACMAGRQINSPDEHLYWHAKKKGDNSPTPSIEGTRWSDSFVLTLDFLSGGKVRATRRFINAQSVGSEGTWKQNGSTVVIEVAAMDTRIEATIDCDRMTGTWSHEGDSTPLKAWRIR